MRGKATTYRSAAAVTAALGALAVAAPAASAASKPGARTGAAANVTQTSATLTGRVDPNGSETAYVFRIGLTKKYTVSTPSASAGAGGKAINVAVPVTGLTPATRYHFRLVARSAQGVKRGRDHTFRTPRQPLFLTLAAAPSPVRPGRSTVLSGVLSGTGNAGRQIALQANPFPYSQGFVTVGDVHLTSPQGGFSFPVLSVGVNTQYRVVLPQSGLASGVVTVGVAVRVTAHVQVQRSSPSARLRFTGHVRPAHDGTQVLVQRRRGGGWATIARTVARHARGGASRYAKDVRIRRGGSFRVVAAVADGDHVGDATRSHRIRFRAR